MLEPILQTDEIPTGSDDVGFSRHARDHTFTVLLLAYVVGVLLDGFYKVPLRLWLFACGAGIIGWSLSRTRRGLSVFLFLLSIGSVAGFWHQLRWRYFPADELGFAVRDAAEPVCLTGRIADFPRLIDAAPPSLLDTMPNEDQTRFRIRCDSVRNGINWHPASGSAQVFVKGHCVGLRPGDRVRLLGYLVQPAEAMNPGEFDFRAYERARRRLFRVLVDSPDCIAVRARASAWDLRWYPQRIRESCQRILFRNLPRPQAELACAMLLGTRDYLSKPRREAFFQTGTIHLLAISGLHVGILASVFFFVMQRTNLCSDRTLLIVIALLTFVYAIITEGKPPVLRASILIWIVCLSQVLHRDGFALNSLSAAALIILVISPAQLFQVGFHLSFLAVIALMWLAPRLVPARQQDPLSKLIHNSRGWWDRQVRQWGHQVLYWCAASVSIWCLTLPIAAYHFHLISPIGLVLNVFLWVPVALALFAGFATLGCGVLAPPLAKFFGAICASSFGCLESVVQGSQPIPGSYHWVAGPSPLVVTFFYGALSLVAVSGLLRAHSLKWFATIAGLTLVIHWLPGNGPRDELRCTFLSVGHGSSVMLEFPNGHVWLYDAGSIAGPEFVVDAVSQYLWTRRIDALHAIIVSHADIDHFNGVPELLNRFTVEKIIASPSMFSVAEATVEVLRDSILAAEIPIEHVSAGSRLASADENGGPVIEVLHPPTQGVEGSDNANSIVLKIDYAGRNILLTGDIELTGLDRLLQLANIDTDVAMAPHHGSPRSDPDRFAAWCRPEWVVISSGRQRRVDAACQLYESPTTRALHTARDGAVTVVIDGAGVVVRSIHGGSSSDF